MSTDNNKSEHLLGLDSLEILKEILEQLPNMVFLKDAKDLKLRIMNRAAEEILCVKREDMIGKSDHELFPKKQANFFTENDRQVLQSGSMSVVTEEPIETPKGTKWLRTRQIPLYVRGEPKYLLGVSEDISDLKIQNQLSEKIQSVSKIGGWELDVDTGQANWTSEVYKIYGVSENSPTTMADGLSFYAEHDRPRLEKYIARAVEKQLPFTGDFEFTDGKNNKKWVRVVGEPQLYGHDRKLVGTVQDVTESVEIAERLKSTTEELNCFFNLSIDMLCIISPEGLIKKVNPMFTEIVGYSEHELLEKPIFDLIAEEDLKKSLAAFDSVKSGYNLTHFENRYITKNGEQRFISWAAVVNGKNGSIYASGRDISSIRSSDEEFKTYTRALDSHAIIARTDRRGVITDVNDNFCEISGYKREELLGQTHGIVNSQYHDEKFFGDMWKSISAGKLWRANIRNKAKDGRFYWVDTTIAPLLSSDGTIKEYISFRYDITAQKNNELMLIDQKVHLDRLIANSPGIVYQFVLEPAGEMYFTFVSQQAYEIYEITAEQFNSDRSIMVKMVHPDDAKALEAAIMESAIHLTTLEFEGRIVTGNRRVKWFHARSVPTLQADGSILWDGLFIDMTKQKNLESELQRQRQFSEHQARLASIGELAAGVGHEINNPLAIVKAFTHILKKNIEREDADKGDTLSTIEKIDRASDRIARIVKGLSTFSRNDSQDESVFDLRDAIVESYDLVHEIFEKDQVNLTLDVDEAGHYAVKGSRSRIQQVIMNLLSNARDALDGRENKNIDIVLRSKNGHQILSISDNGIGIGNDIITKVFDPFFTTKDVNKGTGLGLALAHSIVSDHLGTITLKSELSLGTSFEIRLPKCELPIGLPIELTESKVKTHMNVKKYSALIVDDEPAIREIIGEILTELDMVIYEAGDGAAALAKIKKVDFDLVISDIKMPVMDGPTFLRQLIKEKAENTPKFIFITGGISLNSELKEGKLAKYISAIITKPFDFNEITELIHGVLEETIDQVA